MYRFPPHPHPHRQEWILCLQQWRSRESCPAASPALSPPAPPQPHRQTNNKAKQYSTPKAVTFPEKNELPRVGLEPTTLHSRQSALPLSYQGSSAVHSTGGSCDPFTCTVLGDHVIPSHAQYWGSCDPFTCTVLGDHVIPSHAQYWGIMCSLHKHSTGGSCDPFTSTVLGDHVLPSQAQYWGIM